MFEPETVTRSPEALSPGTEVSWVRRGFVVITFTTMQAQAVPTTFWSPESVKTLVTILVTAFVTATITEPVKLWLQNLWKTLEIRKRALKEMGGNLEAMSRIVTEIERYSDSQSDKAIETPAGFATLFRRGAYEAAQKDLYLFQRIPEFEMVESLNSTCDHIRTESKKYAEALALGVPVNALLISGQLLALAKLQFEYGITEINRHATTRRMMGKVGPKFIRDHIQPKTLGMLMRETWDSFKEDLDEVQKQSEASKPSDAM